MADPSGQKPTGQGPEIRIPDPVQLSRDLAQIAERSQRLVMEFLQRQQPDGMGMADPMNVGQAFLEMTDTAERLQRLHILISADIERLRLAASRSDRNGFVAHQLPAEWRQKFTSRN